MLFSTALRRTMPAQRLAVAGACMYTRREEGGNDIVDLGAVHSSSCLVLHQPPRQAPNQPHIPYPSPSFTRPPWPGHDQQQRGRGPLPHAVQECLSQQHCLLDLCLCGGHSGGVGLLQGHRHGVGVEQQWGTSRVCGCWWGVRREIGLCEGLEEPLL